MQLPPVLNPEQLKRIESMHRGFLYQHLFAVGCLLVAQRAGVLRVIVEQDEDLELNLADSRLYMQVKTRTDQLDWSDIESSVDQFHFIREDHRNGNRLGKPILCIVTNVSPGKALLERIARPTGHRT